ncbi:MAG TPA: hypothetical protein VNZ52_12225 [Candidatus Thermoplasmatota archaeon]|nr:hypothetical protein [Candidatus Thermoplasmatota archaeon]
MPQRLAAIATRALARTSHEQAFHFANGTVSYSLAEFATHLRTVDAGTVQYHRGHFHYWVDGVLGDKTLATRLRMLGERPDLAGETLREAFANAVDTRLETLERETGALKTHRSETHRGKGPRNVPVRRRK